MSVIASTPRVGIAGARGHVGVELLRLLAGHGGLRVGAVISRALAGQPVPGVDGAALVYEDLDPEAASARGLDAWVLALPNGEAPRWAERLAARRPDVVLVDLSADHRFDDGWVYGLPELPRPDGAGRYRDLLRGARRIANPGCYATGMQLALAPLLPLTDEEPVIFGISGYSGAGTTPSPRNDPARLHDNVLPYSLVGHLHEREATRHLGRPVRFVPHVAQFFRGLSLTVSLTLRAPLTAAELRSRLAAAYAGEPLVEVVDEIPELRAAVGRQGVTIGGVTVDAEGRRAVLVATLDNLLKGAATQALQNLNLAFGRPELEGIAA